MTRAAAFLALWPLAAATGECPCITSSSALYSQLRAELTAEGLGADYGTEGCRAYDNENRSRSLFGCNGTAQVSQCENPWCFVDMTVCPFSLDRCAAAGAAPGSDDSPHCRTRRTEDKTILNTSWSYSYETCGSVNIDSIRHSVAIGGYVIKIAATAWAPWVVERGGEFGGPSYDFFTQSLKLFDPIPTVRLIPGWATEQSRRKFASSYTACVHDVAVGNFDLCIADLWLTPERNSVANFLPPLRQDFFYLVVPKTIEEVTFWSYLASPFRPFSVDAWLGVVAFLCGMSLLLWLMQLSDAGFCSRRQKFSWSLAEFGNSLFVVWHDFLLGQSSHDVENGPARKLISVAFSFFILIILASYTASLASILVVKRGAVGEISSIDEAIEKGVSICVPSVLGPTFTNLYSRASFVLVGSQEHSPRRMHAGDCKAMVVSQDVIDSLHAGYIKEQDCNEVQVTQTVTEDEGRCETDYLGRTRDDCNFIRVGEMLWSVPLSFPVSEKLLHSLSWAFTTGLTDGLLEEVKGNKLNKDGFPVPNCAAEEGNDDGVLSLEDLSGTFFISVFIAAAGLVCFVFETLRKGRSSAEEGLGVVDPQESQDIPKANVFLETAKAEERLAAQPDGIPKARSLESEELPNQKVQAAAFDLDDCLQMSRI
ncbi:GLR3.4 [Symbiodinium natans]|uniref:GLR3.4 protein n=1 Tax=Symbiodinium natans TaxID=878477 RepID=A0A812IAL6_9DINO|nr:GLR3.4 [Symbiodinium natans]